MAMADATRQSDALPSISYLNLEKIQRENSLYNSRLPTSAAPHMPAPPLVSPSSMYSGPPPPYSYPSSTASSVVGGHTNGYLSSPIESRPILNNDKKEQQQLIKQSLPSIHEAIHKEPQPISITSLLSKATPAPPPSHSTQQTSNHNPTSPSYRSYRDLPSAGPPSNPSRTQSSPNSHSDPAQSHRPPRPVIDTTSSRQPGSATREPHYPPMLPPRTIPSPSPVTRPAMPPSSFPLSSPAYEPVPRPTSLMNPQHPYNSYPIPHQYASPMSAKTSIHQPPSPSNGQTWRYPDREAERPEDLRRIGVKESLLKPSFGEAVKRHLDNFDLETSLNEVSG
ncbi:MAG: hypothetical protein Q9223_003558 [Gallowayella weberi]